MDEMVLEKFEEIEGLESTILNERWLEEINLNVRT